ncbi:HAD family hydrolase [Lyngbya sp. CCY1209]|jgi:putative hydrolase of the HAD superfamily|uniref:HAD-IA family hydrolase n=1 Tax=Lyngbya sp. CCY1209 TaxID=2886103 RepID=UPI002D210F20|nr:HAD family hydrolase [Lyngbya sp. CCY1209]MEB3884479.1 HAD family hydrolase [Lyngbya sp. CCY1209]
MNPTDDMIPSPKLIFLDAVGTLFGLRDSVGEIYGNIARQWGVDVPAKPLNRAFFHAFSTAPPMAFPDADPDDIPRLEFEWWLDVAARSFKAVEAFDQFADFSEFFVDLYEEFATAKPWFVYPDVIPALKKWRDRDIELAVLSNFDSRLYPLLEALELAPHFSRVTISTAVGAAKPDPKIFAIALKKHGISPSEVLHIGDSLKADCEGAKAAGIPAIWIDRDGENTPQTHPSVLRRCTTFAEIELS